MIYIITLCFPTVSKDTTSKRQILLVFEGLDTVATILVNGIQVGKSKNMFHRYIFDVKGALKIGLNTIKVHFTSAVLYAKGQAKKYPYGVPPQCPVPVQRGECHGNFIRKEQCSFSWVSGKILFFSHDSRLCSSGYGFQTKRGEKRKFHLCVRAIGSVGN